jgi:hypothetical protein
MTTFKELFDFYQGYVKILYSSIQARNVLPAEVLFELNATLDHLARHWAYEESEAQVVSKAYAHLKRSCLDIFKIRVAETIDQYSELRTIDTSQIDGGAFDRNAHQLICEIKTGASEARQLEGDARDENGNIPAFERWAPVFTNCVKFERDIYNNPQIDWSLKRELPKLPVKYFTLLMLLAGVFLGSLVSLAAWLMGSH